MKTLELARERAKHWTRHPFDEVTRHRVKELLDHPTPDFEDAFYTDLEFGTGGLRGKIGPGTNRINRYTIAMASQGLANYTKSVTEAAPRYAIAYDSRNFSTEFAMETARVLASNGGEVFMFRELRPTPLLSYAVRYLRCNAGVVITASHNPPEYNGYKVYWNDGAQVIPPHDSGIIGEVRKVKSPGEVIYSADYEKRIHWIEEDVERSYLEQLHSLSLLPPGSPERNKIRIAYTALHGTGSTLVPRALNIFGFEDVYEVSPQHIPDGDFPTCHSPNPEERQALQMGIEQGMGRGSDILLATDPDADRVGVGEFTAGGCRLFNGNETFALLTLFVLTRRKELGNLPSNGFVAKTIVTSDLVSAICKDFHVPVYETLTGFKYIAGLIREKAGKEEFILGGEESYGYLAGDFVRDKDAVCAACLIAETAQWAVDMGKTPGGLLDEIYLKYGLFSDHLVSVSKEGIEGSRQIGEIMMKLRNFSANTIAGIKLQAFCDFKEGFRRDIVSGVKSPTGLPVSDVVQFFLEDGSRITARPSGTEPKIKFYFSLRETVSKPGDLEAARKRTLERVDRMREELGLF